MEFKFPPIPEGEFEVYADIYAKEGRGDELEDFIRRQVTLAKDEPGTLVYSVSRDDQNPLHFHIFERYSGREALEKHLATPVAKELAAAGVIAAGPPPKFLKALTGF
ncbi:uncharacterized protein PV07_00658 [Cladophialophora immunda]|uniref:ABM domain-containing protein n=1 Tax=Cladophialophora immunda TaxID=569365 RepID=A0A0D2DDQ2_9EURO|nr:uncharacterized protein PV07_00658 [Cladophialophora immunda]KIW33839.1 hypothetical protein PV07_00658 [Cladophialophora immunda]OQU94357.1 hypothetical protein CLAIMM_00718 [Cladophialophora immunda]